jgi:hypothetical protein
MSRKCSKGGKCKFRLNPKLRRGGTGYYPRGLSVLGYRLLCAKCGEWKKPYRR